MEDIHVEQSQYKRTGAPHVLFSGGLGPCIAVGAIYMKSGYMCHTYTDSMEELDRLLSDLKKDVKSFSKLQIYVVGASPSFDSDYEDAQSIKEELADIQKRRDTTLEKIAHAGFQQNIRDIRWGSGNYVLELTLFPAEQRAMIFEMPDEDLFFLPEED